MIGKNSLEILKHNNDTFLYNEKVYKTLSAAKKAKTMDTKRTIKENKNKLIIQNMKKKTYKKQLKNELLKRPKGFSQTIIKYRFNI